MAFDWGSFSGGIVGTVGAFAVALYTLNHQKKSNFPTISKKKYKVIIEAYGILNTAVNDVCTLPINEKITLISLTLKVNSYMREIQKILPDAIEISAQLHDEINQISIDLFLLNQLYYDHCQLGYEENLNTEILEKYTNEFKGIAMSYSARFGELMRDIVKKASAN